MSEPNLPIPTSTYEYYQLLPRPEAPKLRPRYWLHGLLLLTTVFTTLVVGARMEFNFQHNLPVLDVDDSPGAFFPVAWVLARPARLLLGIPFALSLMAILLAHEMGHYLYCRKYGVSATLPFFLPAPTLIGTLGAFIRIRAPIRSRTQLFDIGIAGPIAGFVVALIVLFFSLTLSRVMPHGFPSADVEIGFPKVFQFSQRLLIWAGIGPNSLRLPLNRLLLHPTAIAAWVGMFATSLNLLPGGQLDGGHIVFSIAPRAHRFVSRFTILILLPMAWYLWTGWLIWAILLQLSSFRHPQVAEWPKVSGARNWLAGFGFLMLALTLTPAPFAHGSLVEIVQQFRAH